MLLTLGASMSVVIPAAFYNLLIAFPKTKEGSFGFNSRGGGPKKKEAELLFRLFLQWRSASSLSNLLEIALLRCEAGLQFFKLTLAFFDSGSFFDLQLLCCGRAKSIDSGFLLCQLSFK